MPIPNSEIWWTLTVGTLALVTLGVILVASIVFNQKRFIAIQRQKMEELELNEEQLRTSFEQLRQLSAHLQSVREEERTRISREIHDELGQMLTVLKMDISLLQRKLQVVGVNGSTGEMVHELQSMSGLVDSTIQSVRRIATDLRPEILDELGLKDAIEWEAEIFQSRASIGTAFHSNIDEVALDRDRSTAIFRVFQESLTNVARHSSATNVVINLLRDGDSYLLEIRDNGRGITERELSGPKSLGLLGMRERALFIGGEITIQGKQGEGTTMTLRIPIRGRDTDQSKVKPNGSGEERSSSMIG